MMLYDQKRIDGITERVAKATKGPWHPAHSEWECIYGCDKRNACDKEADTCGEGQCISGAFVPEIKTVEWADYCDMNDDDADFVAGSREDIPYLLSVIQELLDAADTECLG